MRYESCSWWIKILLFLLLVLFLSVCFQRLWTLTVKPKPIVLHILLKNWKSSQFVRRRQGYPLILCFLITEICRVHLWSIILNLQVAASLFCMFVIKCISLSLCYRNLHLLDYVCCRKFEFTHWNCNVH